MKLHNLVSHCVSIDTTINTSSKPADSTFAEYLKQNKSIGSKERKFISELMFFGIRHQILINHLIQCKNYNLDSQTIFYLTAILLHTNFLPESNSRSLNAIYSKIDKTIEPNILIAISKYFSELSLTTEEINNWKSDISNILSDLESKIADADIQALCTRFSFTTTIYELLSELYDYETIKEMFRALSEPANFSIRVNTNTSNINDLFASLAKQVNNKTLQFSNLIPDSINVRNRANLNSTKEYNNGRFEIQDEGIQNISYFLDPKPGETVLDACAGAGGKTLHIANLMKNEGLIVATDTGNVRLKELTPRAKKARIKIIKTELVKLGSKDTYEYKKYQYDKVLIDAPCSGLGTVRRAPFLKYSFSKDKLEELNRRQLGILQHYAKYVKKGGILLYATCSILPQENSSIAQSFLEANPQFELCSINDSIIDHKIKITLKEEVAELYLHPQDYGTDGFYMVKFRKKI